MISVRPPHDVAQADDLNVMTAAHESGRNFRHITGGAASVRRENSRHEKNAHRTGNAARSGARPALRTNRGFKKWRVILSNSGFHRTRDYTFRGYC